MANYFNYKYIPPVDLNEIKNKIAYQFNYILENKEKPYYDKKIVIANEQFFNETILEPNEIGIIITFDSTNIDYNQFVLGIGLNVIGLPNEIDITQQLLLDFAFYYNNTTENDLKQFWNSPSKINSFEEYDNQYRTMFLVNGTVVYGDENVSTKITYIKGEETFDLPILNVVWTFANEPAPRPLYDTDGKCITKLKSQAFAISFTFYSLENELYNDLITNNLNEYNTDYTFNIVFGKLGISQTFTLKNVELKTQEEIGEIGVVSATFSR